MNRITLVLISIIAIVCTQCKQPTKSDVIHIDERITPFRGSFVVLDIQESKTYIYNDSVASLRYPPCSTFKIPNSMIGIETGIAEDETLMIPYDSIKNPAQAWWFNSAPTKYWPQNQTMCTAIKYSVVWYYQELARRIGEERMQEKLDMMDYGNMDISSGIDIFWLCGSMAISAKEQVAFLTKLYHNQVNGFSDRTHEIVKDIMLNEDTPAYKLYGKTGGGKCWPDKVIGWYVGFVETDKGAYVFALNMFSPNFKGLGNKRQQKAMELLKELSFI